MPITKSVKKSLRASLAKRDHNLKVKNLLKQKIKTVDAKNVNDVVSLVDKAAKIHLIHANKASRLKSQLAKRIAKPAEKKIVKSAKKTKKTSKKIKSQKSKKQ